MGRYFLRRLAKSLILLFGVSLLAYVLIDLAPADSAQVIAAQRLGGHPNADQVAWVARHTAWINHLLCNIHAGCSRCYKVI